MPVNIKGNSRGRGAVRPAFVEQPAIAGNTSQAGLAGLGRALSGLGVTLKAQKEKSDRFAVQKALINQSTAVARDFANAAAEAEPGAPDFTKQSFESASRGSQEVINNLREAGVGEEGIRTAELGLMRQNHDVATRGLAFEQQQQLIKFDAELEEAGVQLSNQSAADPDNLDEHLAAIDEMIDAHPGLLNEGQKTVLRKQYHTMLKEAAASGKATHDPHGTVQSLSGTLSDQEFQVLSDGWAELESGHRYDIVNSTSFPNNPEKWAYGKYQVLAMNIPSWTKRVLGRSLTPQEFLAQPDVQEAVFRDQFNLNMRKYGSVRDAISVWFTGRPYAKAVREGAHDGNMSVQKYVSIVENAFKNKGIEIASANDDVVFSKLNAKQRSAVLRSAQTNLKQEQTANKAELETDLANHEAAMEAGLPYEGEPITTDRIEGAFDPIDARGEVAKFESNQRVGEFIAGAKGLSNSELDISLAELEADLGSDTSDPEFAEKRKVFETAEKAVKTIKEARSSDPNAAVHNAFPALSQTAAAAFLPRAGFEERQAYFSQLQRAYDQLDIPLDQRLPFSDETLASVKANFENLDAAGKVAALVEMRGTMGEDLFLNGLDQLADKGFEAEAVMADLASRTEFHTQIATNVMTGLELIREEGTGLKPHSRMVDQVLRKQLGQSIVRMDSRAVKGIKDSAMALYVFNGGSADVNDFDEELMRTSINQVVGGNGNDVTGAVYMNGSTFATVLPPLVTEDQFTIALDSMDEADLSALAQGATPAYATGEIADMDEIRDEGAFVRVASDLYEIRMTSDDGVLVAAETGQPFIVKLDSVHIESLLDRGPDENSIINARGILSPSSIPNIAPGRFEGPFVPDDDVDPKELEELPNIPTPAEGQGIVPNN